MKSTVLRKLVKGINVVKAVTEELQRLGIDNEGVEHYTKIDNYEDLVKFDRLIIDPERIAQIVAEIGNKGKTFYSVIEKAEGNQVSNYSIFSDFTVKTQTGIQIVENTKKVKATETFQQVCFAKDTVQNLLDDIREHGYYSNPAKGKAILVKPAANGYYFVRDLCEDGHFVRCTEEEKDEAIKDLTHYALLTSTNSEMKKIHISALNLNHFSEDYLLNEFSFGALKKAQEDYKKGIKFPMIKLAKALPRFGQQKSPSGKVEPCLDKFGYIILKKPMTMFNHKEFDYEGNKGYEGSSVIDGSCFTREEYLAVILSVKLIMKGLKVIVTPKAVRGMQVQSRIWTFKGTQLAKRKNQFQRLIENIEDECKPDEYEIVGNPNNIVSIMDTDTIKDVFGYLPDFEKYKDAKMFVMAIAKQIEVGTSKFQMLNKTNAVSKEKLLPVIRKLAADTVDKQLKVTFGDDSKSENIVDISRKNTGYINDVLNEMTGGRIMRQDISLASKAFRNFDNTVKKTISKIKLSVDGKSTYGMLSHDVTYLLTRPKYRKEVFGEDFLGLIGYKEVYSKAWNNKVVKSYITKRMDEARQIAEIIEATDGKDAAKDFMKATRQAISEEIKNPNIISRYCFMVKFPAPGLNEIYRAILLTDEEIIERSIKLATKLNEIDPRIDIVKEARMLAESIIDTTAGTIVMPALEPLKAFLAGFDDDGDEAALVWHEDLVSLFKDKKDSMVQIETGGDANETPAINRKKRQNDPDKALADSIDKAFQA